MAKNARKRNRTTFRPGKSGNPEGRAKLAGVATKELVDLARGFASEAFEIVKEIATHGEDEAERLRAARLVLQLANAPNQDEGAKGDPIKIVFPENWNGPPGRRDS